MPIRSSPWTLKPTVTLAHQLVWFLQVKQLFKEPVTRDPETKAILAKLKHLISQLESFEIMWQSQERFHGVANRLATEAVDHFLAKLQVMTEKIHKATALSSPPLVSSTSIPLSSLSLSSAPALSSASLSSKVSSSLAKEAPRALKGLGGSASSGTGLSGLR